MWRTKKKMNECARSAVVLDGEISKSVDMQYFTRNCKGMYVDI